MSMENPLTPAGIEPATFRFVAQHLNHCVSCTVVVLNYFVMCVCVCVCVGFVMCGCFDNYVGVLVMCVMVFSVFLYCFVHVYLFLFVTNIRTTANE